MVKNLTPEIVKIDSSSDFQAVGLGKKAENLGGEESLFASLKGLVSQAKGYMEKAKGFASQAKQDREVASDFASQAQASTVEAGALAQATATLKAETAELKKGSDVSAKNAHASEKESLDALVNTQQEANLVESAKKETVQSQEKVAQAEVRIDEKIARIDEKESIEKSRPLV